MGKPVDLPRPSVVGRIVRSLAAVAIAAGLWLTPPVDAFKPDGLFWVLVAVAAWETRSAWELTTGRGGGDRLRLVAVLIGVVLGSAELLTAGRLWSAGLAIYAYAWMVAVLGLQALSFAVAAVLATPGCEWRAVPHLANLVRGKETSFARCPLHLESFDSR